MNPPENLEKKFHEVFAHAPEKAARAPGRVNLIGEHIDYNGGLVMPVAINREVQVLGRARTDSRFRFYSTKYDEIFETEKPYKKTEDPFWINYPVAVLNELEKNGISLQGLDLLVSSDVPVGSGLSSSAAIEVSTAMLVLALTGDKIDSLHAALLCQRAENQFVGVQCGLMDQAASACCEKGKVTLLDCSVPACKNIPFPEECLSIVVAHCGVSRGLAESEYNARRAQCNEALGKVNFLSGRNFSNLCEVPGELFLRYADQLPEVPRRRARHVISETCRVHDFIQALEAANLQKLGDILNDGHESLRTDYEVSSPQLDELTALCRDFDGVYGSRLTGAGFGGCTVTLVEPGREEGLLAHLEKQYYQKNSLKALCFACRPEDGAGVLELA
jgi:galactokinase